MAKQETTWNYLIVNSFLCSPQFLLYIPCIAWIFCWIIKTELQFGVKRNHFQYELKQNVHFLCEKKRNTFQAKPEKVYLALFHIGLMMESFVIIEVFSKNFNFFTPFNFTHTPTHLPTPNKGILKRKSQLPKTEVLALFSFGISTMNHFVSDRIEMQCFDIFLCGCRAKCLAWNHRGNSNRISWAFG